MLKMEMRAARVSEAQWNILLDFLESHPNLARARCYNNTARGRAESSRQWSEIAELLNAEGSGTAKTPKDWSVYVSNYKSKLKKIVADINADAYRTGGGPPSRGYLSNTELRFLSIMGQGFGQNVPGVAADPLQNMDHKSKSTAAGMHEHYQQTQGFGAEQVQDVVETATADRIKNESGGFVIVEPLIKIASPSPSQTRESAPSPNFTEATTGRLPRRTRQRRYRSRPLAPLDEARRVLSQVELQRAAADMATARANRQIAQNLGRLADAVERYLSHIGVP